MFHSLILFSIKLLTFFRYAPFCKHIFVPNFANCEVPYLEITKDNEHLLRTEYQKRRPEELAVLIRYFPRQLLEENKVVIPKAKYLDLILYSREQVEKENKAMGAISKEEEKEIPWALISVKAQDDNYELPMSPITMMRNALPLEEGGSGVKLDKPKYEESVAYWNKYATIQ